MRKTIFLLLALAAAPLPAQRTMDDHRPPPLPAQADSNDAQAYFRLGAELLRTRPREAADAFYLASELEPGWADALYGRHVALLSVRPERLLRYALGHAETRNDPEVLRIDSLYLDAVRIDPFVRRRFDGEMMMLLVDALDAAMLGVRARPDRVAEYAPSEIRDLPPLLRGIVATGEGDLLDALSALDEALELAAGEDPALLAVHHERARMYEVAGNDSVAAVELRLALEAGVRGGMPFNDLRAQLNHSLGVVLERGGDRDAAREAYAQALIDDMTCYPARRRLALLALGQGDTATAVQELELAVQAGGDPQIQLAYGTLLARTGRLDEAEAQLRAAATRAPRWAEPWLVLGVVLDARGDPRSADAYRGFLARARREDPRRAQVEPVVAASTAP
jgi:tetratricopeptide (TPR) repeat protein